MANVTTHDHLHLSDSISDFFRLSRYKKLLARIDRHEIFSLSGSFAYTTALALSPFVIITLSAFALTNLGTADTLVQQVQGLAGGEASEAISGIIESAQKEGAVSGWSGAFGLILLLVSASAVFSQLRVAFDKISEYRAPKGQSGVWSFLREKIFSVGLVLGFIFLLIISLGASALLAALIPAGDGILLKTLTNVGTFVIFSGLFAAMFRFIPTQSMPWSRCFISGVVATVFFLLGKAAIGLYIGHSAIGSAYGAAGSLIVFLVWIYYTSLTLLLSFEFTNTVVLEKRREATNEA